MIFFLTLRYTPHTRWRNVAKKGERGGYETRKERRNAMQEHENIRNMHRSEDREEGNIRCLISIRAQRSAGRARGQEEEAGVEEREVEGPGQSASVCESAVEGTKGQEGRKQERKRSKGGFQTNERKRQGWNEPRDYD